MNIKPIQGLFAIIMLCLIACQEVSSENNNGNPVTSIVVPDGNGVPVLINGLFSSGEWDDAFRLKVSEDIELNLKKYMGHLFLGINCPTLKAPNAEIFFSTSDTTIYHLHVSAQLSELKLSKPTSENYDNLFRWGNTKDWYANEIRWDYSKIDYLVDSTGMDETKAFLESLFPHDGIELQVLQSKFDAANLKFRFELVWAPGYDSSFVFPKGTNRAQTDSWATLIFE